MEQTMKIFHNPKCRKSREALTWLMENGHNVEIIEYMKTGISLNSLKEITSKMEVSPFALLRKGEDEYEEHIKDKPLDENDILSLMSKYPKLIQRPIVLFEDKAILARPLENLIKAI